MSMQLCGVAVAEASAAADRAPGRLLAKLGQLGVIYIHLMGAITNFGPLLRRSQFALGNRVAKSFDPIAIFEFQEDEEC
jgi:hypothetical protein